jgi:hypothetical protein
MGDTTRNLSMAERRVAGRNAMNQLAKMTQQNDPDARDLAAALQAQPQPRASGGPVTAGRPYVVGENGPELMVPDQSGKIVPSPQLAKARGWLKGGPPVGVLSELCPLLWGRIAEIVSA